MQMFRRFEPLALLVIVLGAINWGILGISDGSTNVLHDIFGSGTVLNVVYVVIGACGLWFVPRLLEEIAHYTGGHTPHPRGT